MPDRFGKMSGPSWRTWSFLSRDFTGVVHSVLKQAMKTAVKRKLSESNIQDFGVATEMEQEFRRVLVSRTEGEALEVISEAERAPGLEQWRR